MTADDIIGVLGWLALGFAYAWTAWSLARTGRGAPAGGSPSDTSKVVELRARRGGGREAGAEPEDDLEEGIFRRAVPPDSDGAHLRAFAVLRADT